MAIKNLYQICLDGLDTIEATRKQLSTKNYHELIFTYSKVSGLLRNIIMTQGNFDNDSLPYKFNDDFDKAFEKAWADWFKAKDLIAQMKVHGIHAVEAKDSTELRVRLKLDPGEYAKMSALGKAAPGKIKNQFQIKMSRRKAYNSAVNYQISKCLTDIYKFFDSMYDVRKESSQYKDDSRVAAGIDQGAAKIKTAQKNRYGTGADKIYGIPSKAGIGLHGEDEDQTTVAMLGFMKSLKKVSGLVSRGQMKGRQNTFWDAKINQISNLFAVKNLKIDKATMADYLTGKKEFDVDKVVIKIELGQAADQSDMDVFDAKKLKKDMEDFKTLALETIRDQLRDQYTVEFETSKSKLQRSREGVPAKVADEVLKSVKHGQVLNNAAKKYKPYKDKARKTGRPKQKTTPKRSKKVTGMMTVAAKKFGTKRSAAKIRTAAMENPLALEALLNELLPKVVASKMTSPALNYRTGRFAQSVETEDVMVGPRGGLQVNYTYMKNPYQTFEPGYRQGSTYRDPRKIIGESIREIAQSIMGDKFLSVRRV